MSFIGKQLRQMFLLEKNTVVFRDNCVCMCPVKNRKIVRLLFETRLSVYALLSALKHVHTHTDGGLILNGFVKKMQHKHKVKITLSLT